MQTILICFKVVQKDQRLRQNYNAYVQCLNAKKWSAIWVYDVYVYADATCKHLKSGKKSSMCNNNHCITNEGERSITMRLTFM